MLISAFTTAVRPKVLEVTRALEEAGLRERVFIMLGGAGVDADFAKEVGADAFTTTATEAAQVALELINY